MPDDSTTPEGVCVFIGSRVAVMEVFDAQTWREFQERLALSLVVSDGGLIVQKGRFTDLSGDRSLRDAEHIIRKHLEVYVPALVEMAERTYTLLRTHRLGQPHDTAESALLAIQQQKTGDSKPCEYHFNIDGHHDTRYQVYRTSPVLETNHYVRVLTEYTNRQKTDKAGCTYKIEINVPAHDDRVPG